MAGTERPFPSFKSNYPTALQPLGRYAEDALAASDEKREDDFREELARASAVAPEEVGGFGLMRAVASRTSTRAASRGVTVSRPGSAARSSRPGSAVPSRPGTASSFRMSASRAGRSSAALSRAASFGGGRGAGSASDYGGGAEDGAIHCETSTVDCAHQASFDLEALERKLQSYTSVRTISFEQSVVSDKMLHVIARTSPFVEELDFTGAVGFTTEGLLYLLRACPKILALRFGKCDFLFANKLDGRNMFTAMSRPSINLLELRLQRCNRVTDDALYGLYRFPPPDPEKASQIEADRLYQEEVEAQKKQAVADRRRELAAAGLTREEIDRSEGTTYIEPSVMRRARTLKELTVEVASPGGWYFEASSSRPASQKAAFHNITKKVASVVWPPPGRPRSAPLPIRCLDLTACRGFTDDGAIYLSTVCHALMQLKLELCDQTGLSDKGIAALISANPELEYIDLTGCTQVSDVTVIAMAAHCPSLKYVLLAGCAAVSDSSVLKLGLNCKQLETLDVSLCGGVSASSIAPMLSTCSKLAAINVTLCSRISDDQFVELDALHPGVKLIRHAGHYTEDDNAGLVPGFKPPPKEQQWGHNTVLSTYSNPGGDKGGKGKGKKKKK